MIFRIVVNLRPDARPYDGKGPDPWSGSGPSWVQWGQLTWP
jgi:hypothetical protein